MLSFLEIVDFLLQMTEEDEAESVRRFSRLGFVYYLSDESVHSFFYL